MEKKQIRPELSAKYRSLTGAWRVIAFLLPASAIALAFIYVFHIVIFGRIITEVGYLYLLIALLLPLVFIWIPLRRGINRDRVPWYDILLALLSFGAPFYFFLNAIEIQWGWA